jgi:hypothetical protein
LIESLRKSPGANAPGRLVSSMYGPREAPCQASTLSAAQPNSLPSDRLRGRDPQLPQHAEVVADRPMLGHFAVRNPEPVRLLNGETLTRWRDAPELALVRAAAHATYRHPIPVRDGVLDVEAVVGEDTPTPLCVFPRRRHAGVQERPCARNGPPPRTPRRL